MCKVPASLSASASVPWLRALLHWQQVFHLQFGRGNQVEVQAEGRLQEVQVHAEYRGMCRGRG